MRISDWSSDVCSSDLFITGAKGEFGTKVDWVFKLTRSSEGEGSVEFVVVHRNDGSEVGRIVREAKFASIPELDDVQAQRKSALSGFIMGAYSTSMGQAVIAEAAGDFARKTKVASYSLTYKGFDQLKESFDEFKAASKREEFTGDRKSTRLNSSH